MKTIAYYISDYGFGHAARSIAIIRELLERDPSYRIIICHSFAMEFLRNSLPNDQVSFRTIATDVGYYLKEGSIEPDKERLVIEFDRFVKDWERKIQTEVHFFQEEEVDFVISDISPLPFEAAVREKIPMIGISNFTWYTAYENLMDQKRLEIWKNSYAKMSYFFLLAGNQENNWPCEKRLFPFFARKIQEERVECVLDRVNPTRKKTVIFFGLGMKIDGIEVESLPLWESDNCVFIVSSNVKVDRDNVFSIPKEETESQAYIAASDLVISKAGWGTVSEAVVYNVPLLILNREGMKEDLNTINYIRKYGLGKTIDWKEMLKYQYHGEKREKKENGFRNEVQAIVEELGKVFL
ncbi:Uncharacterised protein [Mycobacteroides abscessus subsp. abscessus]|nr:Uncharacterised protein [Mycobacteroides abscessus subsp. abscessus]